MNEKFNLFFNFALVIRRHAVTQIRRIEFIKQIRIHLSITKLVMSKKIDYQNLSSNLIKNSEITTEDTGGADN